MPWINSTFEKPVWIWLHFNPQMCWKRRTVHGFGQFCSTKYWWGHSKGYFFYASKKNRIWNGNFSYRYSDKYALYEKKLRQILTHSKDQSISDWIYEVIVSPKIHDYTHMNQKGFLSCTVPHCCRAEIWFKFWEKRWLHKFSLKFQCKYIKVGNKHLSPHLCADIQI